MTPLHCCFCGVEVATPAELRDPTTLAVCNKCYALGGRLPLRSGPRPWRARVDEDGRIRSVFSRKEWFRYHFAPNAVVGTISTVMLLVLMIGVPSLAIKAFMVAPMQAALLLAIPIAIYAIWREALRRW